jgi:alpha-tubulin suppressor-like RCC1 family protein
VVAIERRLMVACKSVTRRGRFVAAVVAAVVPGALAAGAVPGHSAGVAVPGHSAGAFSQRVPAVASAARVAAGSAAAIAPVRALAAGEDQTCALVGAGGVDCWGANVYGQLGDGMSRGPQSCNGDPCASTPVAVEGIAGATAIAAGGGESCALLSGGRVDCWGENMDGQLGDGTSAGPQSCDGEPCSSTPVAVEGIAGASAIAVGGGDSCALLAGGKVDCWGENAYGQLGDGTSRGPQSCDGDSCASTPVAVDGISGATAIAAGSDHVCALLGAGGVDCWGYNFAAELGIGTSSGVQLCTGGEWCSTKPVGVFGLASATSIVAGGDHTCVLVRGGGVQCWGYNSYGQLGDGLSSGPQVCYWQLVQCAKTPVAVSTSASASAVTAGGEHTCALLDGGSVSCWGANWFGDLGDGVRSGPHVCNGYPCSATPVVVSRPPS